MTALVLMCLSAAVLAQTAGADNRYCRVGNEPTFGKNDGPAALPQSCFYTDMSATPAQGKVIRVGSGTDLQEAINRAQCGDVLELTAGSVFAGDSNFPPKGCDDHHWIWVRSGGSLPPEGTRLTPCYAGLASLPGRPDFHCSSSTNTMARLVVGSGQTIRVADHYRFMGLEITRQDGAGTIYNLVTADNAEKVIFDRVWMHGNDHEETVRGLAIPGARHAAVIDSFFSDFHCIAITGSCTDSQAIWGGTGDDPGGTYKIVNNYLEAGAEGIMFGGGPGTTTPVDIEIRRNYIFKPLTWKPDDPSYRGPRFIVKNNFELKNAVRVLLEGNVMENSWGGFSQSGYQILLTPNNPRNTCPVCVVHDITIRYCVLRHSGAGITLAAAPSDEGNTSQGLFNVSIHDLTVEDIASARFDGNGFALQVTSDGSTYHDFAIRHVTIPFGDRALLMIGAPPGRPIQNVFLTDNIFQVGKYEATSSGGSSNCADHKISAKEMIDSCWRNYEFKNNVVIGASKEWPRGNFLEDDLRRAGVMVTEGGSPHLAANGRYRGKGKDGRDIGADMVMLEKEIAGVAR